jgi:hypothetical protein
MQVFSQIFCEKKCKEHPHFLQGFLTLFRWLSKKCWKAFLQTLHSHLKTYWSFCCDGYTGNSEGWFSGFLV